MSIKKSGPLQIYIKHLNKKFKKYKEKILNFLHQKASEEFQLDITASQQNKVKHLQEITKEARIQFRRNIFVM